MKKKVLAVIFTAALCAAPLTGMAAAYQSLTTLFNGTNVAQGFMFDLEVLGSEAVIIQSFDINILQVNAAMPIAVYYREGGYSGYETNAAAWTLAGSAVIATNSLNTPTQLPVGGFQLSPGKTYGVYIATEDLSVNREMVYSMLLSTPAYQDAHLKLTEGVGIGNTTLPFSGPIYTSRMWNGTVYYTVVPPAPSPTPTPSATPAPPVAPETGDRAGSLVWGYLALAGFAGAAMLLLAARLRAARR